MLEEEEEKEEEEATTRQGGGCIQSTRKWSFLVFI